MDSFPYVFEYIQLRPEATETRQSIRAESLNIFWDGILNDQPRGPDLQSNPEQTISNASIPIDEEPDDILQRVAQDLSRNIVTALELIRNGADPNVLEQNTQNDLLERALELNDPEAAMILMRNGATITNPRNISRNNLNDALQQAIENNLFGVAVTLIDSGASLADGLGREALNNLLEAALNNDRYAVAVILIDHGANPASLDQTILNNLLQLAISNNNLRVIVILIQNGAAIPGELTIETLNEILRQAVTLNYPVVAVAAIERGANPDVLRQENLTYLLEYAVLTNNFELIVKLIKQHGANPNINTQSGVNLLSLAINLASMANPNAYKNTILALVMNGAELDRCSPQELQQLMILVAKRGHGLDAQLIMQNLLRAGGDINTTDENNNSLLMLAIVNGDPKVLEFFLTLLQERKINTKITNSARNTARTLAELYQRQEILSYL